MHTRAKMAHIDLKLENILVGDDAKVKICDFGLATSVDNPITKVIGTPYYCAPEALTANAFNSYKGIAADIFSLGVILFILAFGAPPFTRPSMDDVNYRIFLRNPQGFWKTHPNVRKS